MDRYVSTYYDSMETNDNGDWVRYEDAAARIAAELEQCAAKMKKRILELSENEAAVAASYNDAAARIAELEAQLAAAQERNTNLQSEHLDHVSALHKRIKELEKKNDHK